MHAHPVHRDEERDEPGLWRVSGGGAERDIRDRLPPEEERGRDAEDDREVLHAASGQRTVAQVCDLQGGWRRRLDVSSRTRRTEHGETYRILGIAVSALPMLRRQDRTGDDVPEAQECRDVGYDLAHRAVRRCNAALVDALDREEPHVRREYDRRLSAAHQLSTVGGVIGPGE